MQIAQVVTVAGCKAVVGRSPPLSLNSSGGIHSMAAIGRVVKGYMRRWGFRREWKKDWLIID